MRISVRYGKGEASADVPDERLVAVLRASPPHALPNADEAILEALRDPTASPPLRDLAAGRASAVVVVCDITRPAPNELMLRHVLSELEAGGLPAELITVLVATGGHRPNEGAELAELVGAGVAEGYRCVNHDAQDSAAHEYLGETPQGVPVWVDGEYLAADLKVLTGLVEPHYMAGFSGGRKLVCPGLAAVETIREFHRPDLLLQPTADTGILKGNPVHEAALAAAHMAGVDFVLNTAVDESRQVTGVWAGGLERSHGQACEAVGSAAEATCPEPVDIVITSNAGWPLDCNIYQATKGMVGALPVLANRGTVIIAAECREGLGSQGFARVLREHSSLDEMMARLGDTSRFSMDQWGVVMLWKAVTGADVWLLSDGVDDNDARAAFMTPVDDLQRGIDLALAKHGPEARIAVIPDGPYVIPKLAEDVGDTGLERRQQGTNRGTDATRGHVLDGRGESER